MKPSDHPYFYHHRCWVATPLNAARNDGGGGALLLHTYGVRNDGVRGICNDGEGCLCEEA
ncbi:MAG: hypothetical protein HS120_09855 [Burkholderiales bacterium]|nr:hypothetical protein [Burkholderiales bacterium]